MQPDTAVHLQLCAMPAAAGLCCAGIYRQHQRTEGAGPVVLRGLGDSRQRRATCQN